jgi:chlorobactene glucosyltransferase
MIQQTKVPVRDELFEDVRQDGSKISLLIPARNEAHNVPRLFAQLAVIEDQVDEIILLDDASEDKTATLISEHIASRKAATAYRLIRGNGPPPGWLGKNFACHCLAEAATGDFLLFIDADVAQVDKRLIASVFHQIKKHDLSLLSIFPDQYIMSRGEQVIVPLMHYLLLSLLPLRWILALPFPSMAAANGQCMLFEANTYRKHRWHERVKGIIVEDIAIMREVKRAGLRGLAFTANSLIHTRMYRGLKDAISGFGKNILAGFRNNIPGLLLYLMVLLIWLPWIGYQVALAALPWYLLPAVLVGILFTRIGVSKLAGQSVLKNCLYHPLQMLGLLFISLRSINNKIQKRNTWKGRNVQL